jgi:hypothetical protein
MRDFGDDLKLIRDLAVKREMDSGNYRWFGKEAAELTRERGFPVLGAIAFLLVLSTEWGVGRIIAFAFWAAVFIVVVVVSTMVVQKIIDLIKFTPTLRRIVTYSLAGWVVFHLIKFHFWDS